MKKVIFTLLLVWSAWWVGFSQDISSKLDQVSPRNKNAGRVVKMKKVMTITDEQGGFFFRMPEDMQIGTDGSIYLKDYYQLLRFNEKGKLLNNFHKEGQGPGEFGFRFNYILGGDSVIVFSAMPNKIIWFDKKGTLIREFRMKEFAFGDLLLYRSGKYYFVTSGMPWVTGKARFVNVDYKIFEFSQDGFNHRKLFSFPVEEYAMSEGQMRNSYVICEFKARAYNNKFLVVNHTPIYLIKIYDVEKNSVIRSFSRIFKRQPWTEKRWEGDKTAPKIEYDNDVQDIFVLKDKLWIVTSIQEKAKGRLIDVFDYEGNYLDNFYLKLNGQILGVQEEFVYVREYTKTDHLIINKYRQNSDT